MSIPENEIGAGIRVMTQRTIVANGGNGAGKIGIADAFVPGLIIQFGISDGGSS